MDHLAERTMSFVDDGIQNADDNQIRVFIIVSLSSFYCGKYRHIPAHFSFHHRGTFAKSLQQGVVFSSFGETLRVDRAFSTVKTWKLTESLQRELLFSERQPSRMMRNSRARIGNFRRVHVCICMYASWLLGRRTYFIRSSRGVYSWRRVKGILGRSHGRSHGTRRASAFKDLPLRYIYIHIPGNSILSLFLCLLQTCRTCRVYCGLGVELLKQLLLRLQCVLSYIIKGIFGLRIEDIALKFN